MWIELSRSPAGIRLGLWFVCVGGMSYMLEYVSVLCLKPCLSAVFTAGFLPSRWRQQSAEFNEDFFFSLLFPNWILL